MRNPDAFDAFYKDARDRLLLQTYALTGDLTASRTAVRDSFVVAWHHWRKIGGVEDPESWARPHAWAHAQRRHTARLWHRDKGLDPEVTRTLDALGKLPLTQRKMLLLNHLTRLSLDDAAREVGLTRSGAERELQTATTQLALHRDVSSAAVRPLFEPMRAHLSSVRWPRPTILRRAGAARRRTHTTVGAVAAVAALVLTGSLVTDAAGVRPTLDRDTIVRSGGDSSPASAQESEKAPPPPDTLPQRALLPRAEVARLVDGRRWTTAGTTANTSGTGLVLPCQQERYADPRGKAALVRTFETSPRRRAPAVSASQSVEVSRNARRAERTFATTAGWYAGCTDRRVQLLSTQRVRRVGDEAVQLVLRSWDAPATTLVVGVARTGQVTTTTLTSVAGTAGPHAGRSARLLASAVSRLCDLPDAGGCGRVGAPRLATTVPLPTGQVPAMLSAVDLPPVPGVERPWVGTEPRRAFQNVASTSCDHADFGGPMTTSMTRSFVVPRSRLAPQFGLTETVGSLPAARAAAFVDTVRARMDACPDKELGTKVASVRQVATAGRDLSVWRVTSELNDSQTISYLMGIVRTGTSIAQVGFVPDGEATISAGAFAAVVQRALDRVDALPPPRRTR
jgi:DNA-directed RNA polymerase specialized sigma24 family protein